MESFLISAALKSSPSYLAVGLPAAAQSLSAGKSLDQEDEKDVHEESEKGAERGVEDSAQRDVENERNRTVE